MKIPPFKERSDEELDALWRDCTSMIGGGDRTSAADHVRASLRTLIDDYKALRAHHIEETTELWRRLKADNGGSDWMAALTHAERTRAVHLLVELVHGGEFAAWLERDNPEMTFAAGRELDEAQEFVRGIIKSPPR